MKAIILSSFLLAAFCITRNLPVNESSLINASTRNNVVLVHQQPAPLKITYSANNPSGKSNCDGSIKLSIDGGKAPYSINWSNGQSGTVLTGLCGGTLTVTVTDAAGNTASEKIKITAPAVSPLIIKGEYFFTGDEGPKQVDLTIVIFSGNPPYSYEWSDGSYAYRIKNASDGIYKVKVRDAANQVDTCRFTVKGDKVMVEGRKS